MIRHPHLGQRVELHYSDKYGLRAVCRHLATGTVRIVAKGPGPRSAMVELDDGAKVIVPNGHLMTCGCE